ncbi:TPA: hypothetical protein ACY2HE_002315 [Yersinia enterocolitica]|uniref:hypothetical protein n=1 Tax=Yersinia enterocolitica TaxID=630 RepID=UPI00067D385F|nr:hypothetical protein [Yersinia enterocolitica]
MSSVSFKKNWNLVRLVKLHAKTGQKKSKWLKIRPYYAVMPETKIPNKIDRYPLAGTKNAAK